MSSSRPRPSNIPGSIEAFADRQLPVSEEVECQRKGYILSSITLGKGAYAKVKLAFVTTMKLEKEKYLRQELNKQGNFKVAIKIISKDDAPTEYLNKFMPREIQALTAINGCPNVVKLFEAFYTGNRIYLVLEYADNGDLLEFINARKSHAPGIGEAKAKLFFKQLVQGLDYCHNQNIVHRDIKCENILIQSVDVLKISDFGFATRFPNTQRSLLETFCGSYAYSAPEILRAEKYDGRAADVWSLGIILFAMLNGRLPFKDGDIPSILRQTRGKLHFSSKVQLSSECQDLVKRILTANERNRITIPEILKHSWLKEEDGVMLGVIRGVPEGKSDKSIEDAKLSSNSIGPSKPKEEKIVVGNKLDIYTPGNVIKKWLAKNKGTSAMAKHLHCQVEDSAQPQPNGLSTTSVDSVKDKTSSNETKLCKTPNMMFYTVSNKHPANVLIQKSLRRNGRTEETQRDIKTLPRKVKVHAYRYQKDAEKRAVRPVDNEESISSLNCRNIIKSSEGIRIWSKFKVPAKNLMVYGREKSCHPESNVNGEVVQGVSLPPVGNESSRSIFSTAQPKLRKHAEQKDAKAVPKERYKKVLCGGKNSSKILNFAVNLRNNRPKIPPRILRKKKENTIAYYTLSGKEVETRMKDRAVKYNFTDSDIFRMKAPQ